MVPSLARFVEEEGEEEEAVVVVVKEREDETKKEDGTGGEDGGGQVRSIVGDGGEEKEGGGSRKEDASSHDRTHRGREKHDDRIAAAPVGTRCGEEKGTDGGFIADTPSSPADEPRATSHEGSGAHPPRPCFEDKRRSEGTNHR